MAMSAQSDKLTAVYISYTALSFCTKNNCKCK